MPAPKNILRRTIERGLANGKLEDELRELGELNLKYQEDGEAICWALRQLGRNSQAQLPENTYALAGLFQSVDGRDSPAYQVLQAEGIPELIRLFDTLSLAADEADTDTLLFLLKILALYGTVEGTLKIVEAARRPLAPGAYLWSVILGAFTAGHPENEMLFRSLSNPLPEGFIGICLLDAANALLLEGESMPHPFDTAEGHDRLREWLSSEDPACFSYAHSATAALAFLGEPGREPLLQQALVHPDVGVRVEAAWAAAKLGDEDGLERLADYCRDLRTAQVAKHYLVEMGRADVIPPAANEPGFAALAEFAQWCAHPNELGRVPDKLEIMDHRTLRWPPEREPKPLWLIKYTLHDATGLEDDDIECGMVGSITFCLFSYHLEQRPPEDAYAVHCYWEMEQQHLIEESDVRNDQANYASLWQEWSGPALADAKLHYVAEISPELKYPQRLVGLAAGSIHGRPGWLVLDGPRTQWYPRAAQPCDSFESVTLKIHVGRHLLGLADQPDRSHWLAPPRRPKPPEQITRAYEKLLADAQAARGEAREDAFETYRTLGKHFEAYVEALLALGRRAAVPKVFEILAPEWEDPDGLGKLGRAALKAGFLDLAETYLRKYRDHAEHYERGEEMVLLAQLWRDTGKAKAARELLIDCLDRLVELSKSAKHPHLVEDSFQEQRLAFLRLFPDDGEPFLADRRIPRSTLASG